MEETGRSAWLAPAVRPTPRRPRGATAGASSAFPVRPDCSVAVAARGAEGAEAAHKRPAAVSPTPPHPAVCSRRSCQVSRSGSWRENGLFKWIEVFDRGKLGLTEQQAAHPGRFCRVLRSGPARSDQARPSDFIALLGEGPQVKIAEPDRPVAVIALGQRDRLFPVPRRLGWVVTCSRGQPQVELA